MRFVTSLSCETDVNQCGEGAGEGWGKRRGGGGYAFIAALEVCQMLPLKHFFFSD